MSPPFSVARYVCPGCGCPTAPGRGPLIRFMRRICSYVVPPMLFPVALCHAYSVRPEQSKPRVPAPRPIPYDGPPGPPPPHEYGTPICERAALTARSEERRVGKEGRLQRARERWGEDGRA